MRDTQARQLHNSIASEKMDLQVLHAALVNTLHPFGDNFRNAQAQLEKLETEPAFITSLLGLLVESSVDLAVRRAGAVYLKNKINRSWGTRTVNSLSPEDKAVFKAQVIKAIVPCHPSLRDFLMVCVLKVMDYDYQRGEWPELLPETVQLLQNTEDLSSITGGLLVLKQICKFYRWNTGAVNKQLDPLMTEVYPHILRIAEAAMEALVNNNNDAAANALYYEMIYNVLKIYKLSTTRFLPDIIRDADIAKRTIEMFLRIFMLPLPDAVLAMQPASERNALLPVKCQKWATANILRTHQTYLVKSYSQLNENATKYAPYRQLFLSVFAPELTKVYIQKLQQWSQQQLWFSDTVLYNVVSYLDAMIDFKHVFTEIIEPQIEGLLGQVLFPLLFPSENDLDLFEDDPVELLQRKNDFSEVLLTSGHAAADFINHSARKRKSTTPLMVEFLNQCAARLVNEPDAVREIVGLFALLQALYPIYQPKKSALRDQLEPFVAQHIIPGLASQHAYLRYEACNTVSKLSSFNFASRDTTQQLFQGVLSCFFDAQNLPVQVAAALTLQSLSVQEFNGDVRAALGQHITEVIQNLLGITQQIDLESLLAVLDHFVEQFPDRITPFAVELAAQLCQQFVVLAAELNETYKQSAENGELGAVGSAELMMAGDEKAAAGFGIMNSLANLQNNLEHQREITARLDEQISPVFLAVYQNELDEFYPDCLSLHENTLFTLKVVPSHHWQYFEALLGILQRSAYQYFDDAMPVLENYILHGSQFLAQNPQLLSKFIHLLVSLYAPSGETGESGEIPTSFSDGQTRAHVMSVTTKLMVSSDLFNGPLIPHIPTMVGALIARVNEDARSRSTFPPRYNVAAVSVVLASLYHDPAGSLVELRKGNAVESFFETWLQTVPEFTRVNDLKLCIVAVLSILSYQVLHPEFKLDSLSHLLQTMTKSLAALPGAAAKEAELMKRENDGLWDDDEFDELDDEVDDEYDPTIGSEATTNDASAEFEDQMPESSVAAAGSGTFFYEQPGPPSEQPGNEAEGEETSVEELRSALVTQMGFIAEDFGEDMYSVSPLDDLNPYDALRTVLLGMQTTKPEFYLELLNSMPEADKASLDESLQREAVPAYSVAPQ